MLLLGMGMPSLLNVDMAALRFDCFFLPLGPYAPVEGDLDEDVDDGLEFEEELLYPVASLGLPSAPLETELVLAEGPSAAEVRGPLTGAKLL